MNKLKTMNKREKAEAIAIVALYPFFMLFRFLGKTCQLFGTKTRQITASVLSLAMILTILPVMAFAASSPEVYVNDFVLSATNPYATNDENGKLTLGGDKDNYNVKFDAATSTLTLNNANIKHSSVHGNSDAAIWSDGNLNIVLADNTTNTASAGGAENGNSYGIYSNADITISGGGTLDTSSGLSRGCSYGIFSGGTVTISDGNLIVAGNQDKGDSFGIYGNAIIISGGALEVRSTGSTGKIMNTAPVFTSYLPAPKITASTIDASVSLVTYNESDLDTYKYMIIEPPTYTVGGNPDLFGSMWDPVDESNRMVYDATTQIFFKIFENVNEGDYEFRIAMCGSWGTSWGDPSTPTGNAVAEVSQDGSTVKITFDPATKKIGVEISMPQQVVEVSSWEGLQTVFTNGGTAKLTQNVVAGSEDARLELPKDVTAIVDLNGFQINRNLKTAVANGEVIFINGGNLTINDSSLAKTGEITGGNTTGRGGGVNAVGSSARSTFTMNGGSITSNAASEGSAVYACNATVVMTGGSITKNTASKYGSVYVDTSSNFTMDGGSITDNTVKKNGGGVYVDNSAAFTMNDGSITGNKATNGGGVYIFRGNFNMMKGSISSNDASSGGGGVYCSSSFTMNDGSITGNTASYYGGGVYCDKTITMTGGSITSNMVTSTSNAYGGGVYCDGWLYVCGSATITNNTLADKTNAHNVYLKDGHKMSIKGALLGEIGVSTQYATYPVTVMENSSNDGYKMTEDDVAKLKNDKIGEEIALVGNVAVLVSTKIDSWSRLQIAMNKGGNIKLMQDIIATDGDSPLTVPSGKTVTLDLNGWKIDRNMKRIDDNGNVISVNGGNLTIIDSSTNETGTITGGYSMYDGGGVCITNNGSLTMTGGTITGNGCNGAGGGVYYENGTFTVGGSASVKDNVGIDGSTDNVSIQGSNQLTVASALTGEIFVNVGSSLSATAPVSFAKTSGYTLSEDDVRRFRSDVSGYWVALSDNAAVLQKSEINSWSTLQAAIDQGGSIKLTQDIVARRTDSPLTVASGKTVTIDLNGWKINRNLTSAIDNGSAICIDGGNLTIIDTYSEKTGAITGGYTAGNGGGVQILNGGTLQMTGGTISGNRCGGIGGGVYYGDGTFIVGNCANIKENTGKDGAVDNVSIEDTNKLTVVSALEGKIGVSVRASTTPYTLASGKDYTVTADDTAKLVNDLDGRRVGLDASNNSICLSNPVSRDELKELYYSSDDYVEKEYTTASWKTFQSARSDAYNVYIDKTTTPQQIGVAYDSLIAERNNLESAGTNTELINQYNIMNRFPLYIYTEDSQKAIEDAMNAVKKYFSTTERYSQAEYDSGYQLLKTAQDNAVYQQIVLAASAYRFAAPSNLYYNGSKKTSNLYKTDQFRSYGSMTIHYYDENGVRLDSAPINIGTYTVKIDVTESVNFYAATDLTGEDWTFTILPMQATMSEIVASGIDSQIYTGSQVKPVPTLKYKSNTLTEGVDYTLEYGENTEIGKGTVKVNFMGNFSGSLQYEFSIAYDAATSDMYRTNQNSINHWYREDIIISGQTGYTISKTPTNFGSSISLSEQTDNGSQEIYLKGADGKIYQGTFTYKLDKTNPDGTISFNARTVKKVLNIITFGLLFKENVDVVITSSDENGSGVATTEYYKSDSVLDEAAIKNISDWTTYRSFTVAAKDKDKFIIYVKVTDNAGNVTYFGTDGATFDTVEPRISVTDGQTYCAAIEVTVDDDNLDTVTLYGTKMTLVDGKFTVSPKTGVQTIVATDKVQNSKTVKITVNNGHTPNDDDGDCTTAIRCQFCDAEMIAAKSHSFGGAYVADGVNGHYQNCQNEGCTKRSSTAGHVSEDDNNCETASNCTVCGFELKAAGTHDFSGEWQKDKTDHWHLCQNSGCTVTETKTAHDYTIKGEETPATYFADGERTDTCVCGATNTVVLPKLIDQTTPSASVKIGNDTWNKLLNNVTFGVFFKETQTVSVTASDDESGVNKIYYYLATSDKVPDFSTLAWTESNGSFTIDPNHKYVVYIKVTDRVGNETVINSDGIVLDNVVPQIGAQNGKIYCAAIEVTVADDNIDTVTLDGTEMILADGKFTVSPKAGAQTIVATDKAKNSTTVAITVNNGHTWDDGKVTTEPTAETEGVKTFTCKHCDATKTETVIKLTPTITEGKDSKYKQGSKDGLTFKSDAALADLQNVAVDGKELDKSYYTTAKGSTIVTLKPEYLDTLSAGTHTLDIHSASGTASTQFIIAEKDENAGNAEKPTHTTSPLTGDTANVGWWILLFFVSGGALTVFGVSKKRKKADSK